MTPTMTYEQALDYIHSCKRFGSKKNGLENMLRLAGALGNPQRAFPVIHVAGTNGKGSTSAMVAAMLRQAGLKTALYTSPYLERYNERMCIDGAQIDDEMLAKITLQTIDVIQDLVQQGMDHPTEFELGTAIALQWFHQQQVDVAVIEVGLGGRLDPTNIIEPDVSVICAIGMDHTAVLGDTLAKIAEEKAGIIKPRRPVVLYPQGEEVRRVIARSAQQSHAPLTDLALSQLQSAQPGLSGQHFSLTIEGHHWQDLFVPLLGLHQAANAATAVAAIHVMDGLHPQWNLGSAIRLGLSNTRWPGRLEIVHTHPLTLLDGAHNAHGARALSQALSALLPGKRIHLVTGILQGKDAEGIAQLLAPHVKKLYITRPDNPRARDPLEVAMLFDRLGLHASCFMHAKQAVSAAMEQCEPDDAVLIAGSLYLVGEVRPMFHT